MTTKSYNLFGIYRIPTTFRGIFLTLAILFYSPLATKMPPQQTTTSQPLQIVNVTVSPQPIVDQVVTLEVEIMSLPAQAAVPGGGLIVTSNEQMTNPCLLL